MPHDKQSSHFDDPIPISDDELEPIPVGSQDDEPIPIISSEESTISLSVNDKNIAAPAASSASAQSAVRGIKTTLDISKRTQFKRAPHNTGQGAVRCRLFHCKIAESSMGHMEDVINTWMDDEEVDVKHIGHMVGMLEGKHTEPNIIVMIWY